jgi:hypothetical protein
MKYTWLENKYFSNEGHILVEMLAKMEIFYGNCSGLAYAPPWP